MTTEEETKTEETKAPDADAGDDAAPEEHENTTYYEPVVSPLRWCAVLPCGRFLAYLVFLCFPFIYRSISKNKRQSRAKKTR